MLSIRYIAALFALSLAAGCTREPAQNSAAQPAPPPATPLVTVQAATSNQPATDVLTSSIPGAGAPATYQASFIDGHLERIEEMRDSGSGNYEFRGARLLKYSGPSTSSDAQIEIELSLQGAVVAARSSAGKVSAEEISAIRSRAQLLRSQALAQKAVRSHQSQ